MRNADTVIAGKRFEKKKQEGGSPRGEKRLGRAIREREEK